MSYYVKYESESVFNIQDITNKYVLYAVISCDVIVFLLSKLNRDKNVSFCHSCCQYKDL